MEQLQHVPSGSMAGMIFSLIVSVGLPIVLCIYIKRKKKGNLFPVFVGSITFIIAALVLESIFHSIMLKRMGNISTLLQTNMILYAVYGGLAAGIFEETGRFAAMHFFMRKKLTKVNALMYGIGHGGIEAILIVGLSSISNLIFSMQINRGMLISSEEGYQAVKALIDTPSWQFYFGGIERVMAVSLQISFSVLVYEAVKFQNKRWYYLLAVILHALVDAITLLVSKMAGVLLVEGFVLLATVIVAFLALQEYRRIPED